MESTEIVSLLEQLDDDIDDLEDSLEPILKSALSIASSKLPLLDRAKLYVLITYAIESILFSYLRLHGVAAREHPVFKELTRVKQYFSKIKSAETPSNERPVLSLDRQAAARFVKSGLAGNKSDSKGARRQEVETNQLRTRIKTLSKSTNRATGSPSSVTSTSNSSLQKIDSESAETGPGTSHLTSKKRKAD